MFHRKKYYQQHFLRQFLTHKKVIVTCIVSVLIYFSANKKTTSDKIIRVHRICVLCFISFSRINSKDVSMVFHFFTIHNGLPKGHAIHYQIIHFDSCMCRLPQITFMFNYTYLEEVVELSKYQNSWRTISLYFPSQPPSISGCIYQMQSSSM